MASAAEPKHMKSFVQKMEAEGLSPIVIDTFVYYYKQVVAGETGLIYERDLVCTGPEDIEDLAGLHQYAETHYRTHEEIRPWKIAGNAYCAKLSRCGKHRRLAR